jgi:hypothetical protein
VHPLSASQGDLGSLCALWNSAAQRWRIHLSHASRIAHNCHVQQDSEGISMTTHAGFVSDIDADGRWREWQTRNAARDRRTAVGMRALMLLIIAGLAVWSAVLFA